jgi:hypothetical protein
MQGYHNHDSYAKSIGQPTLFSSNYDCTEKLVKRYGAILMAVQK